VVHRTVFPALIEKGKKGKTLSGCKSTTHGGKRFFTGRSSYLRKERVFCRPQESEVTLEGGGVTTWSIWGGKESSSRRERKEVHPQTKERTCRRPGRRYQGCHGKGESLIVPEGGSPSKGGEKRKIQRRREGDPCCHARQLASQLSRPEEKRCLAVTKRRETARGGKSAQGGEETVGLIGGKSK